MVCAQIYKLFHLKGSVSLNENNNINYPEKQNDSVSGTIIVGFALGLTSCFLDFFGIVGIIAIVFSAIGLSQLSRTDQKGKVLAIIGLVSGIVSSVIYSIFIIIMILF